MRLLILLCLPAVLLGCAGPDLPPPSHDREWQGYVSRHATVSWHTPARFSLRNVRNWEWNADGPVRKRWETRRHDLDDLRAIWFFVEPFPGAPAFAHTFITFEFGEGRGREFLSVSVEARREIGEDYSAFRGLRGDFELIFAWSTERDILTDSVLNFGHEMRMYRVNVTPEQARRILRGFLARTEEIARRPERYNTLRHNCTTELAAVVNREFGDPIPWHTSFVFTGGAAKYLHRLGYLGEPERPFRQVRARARVERLIAHFAELSERRFSAALREGLAAMAARRD